MVEALGAELTRYLSGRGTIRFPARDPMPTALVAWIVEVRVAENGARARQRAMTRRQR